MEHAVLKTKLSDYLEDAVPPQEKAVIEEHIAACPECRHNLTEMTATRRHIQSLGEVEPPPWLTGKILARVREQAEQKSGIFRRLFYPLHRRLPVEAVGLIFLTVMVYYIIRDIQPELKTFPAGSEKAYEKEGLSQTSETTASAKPAEEKREIFQKEESRSPAESLAAPGPKGGVPPSSEGPATKPGEFARKQAVAPQTQSSQSSQLEEVAAKPGERSEMMGKKETAPSLAPRSAESFKDLSLKEEKKMGAPPRLAARGSARDTQALHLTLRTQDATGAGRKLEEAVTQLGGKIIKKESVENVQIFSVQIAAEKMAEFGATLGGLGKVQDAEWPAQEAEGDRFITIKILPASTQP